MNRANFTFDQIARWPIVEPAVGAVQMALDEVMLRRADLPVLRVYRWAEHEVTFGYPQRWEDARAFAGSRPITRRCTGGGMVEHGEDVTVALVVPATHPFSRLAPAKTYRRIHEAIREALGGGEIRLAGEADRLSGPACFASPAPSDVLMGDRKVAGGAQRRSREGFLYQGSIQGVAVADGFGDSLGVALARDAGNWNPPADWETLRDELLTTRYGREDWNKRR